jgi:branched-chain amino acid aminotransferase
MEIKTELTKNKKSKPDPGALGFGIHFTDHMLVAEYNDGGWRDAKIIPFGEIPISPAAIGIHYGQAVFEGLKCYMSNGKPRLFRPDQNFARLNSSLDRLCMPRIDEKFALKALIELIKTEREWIPDRPGQSLYIRPFAFATEPCLGVRPSQTYNFLIILSPSASYYKGGLAPVKIGVEDNYVRAVRGGVGFTKAAANYAVSLKAQESAKNSGCEQVLWLDGIERKYIEEVGSMNIFFKIAGEVVTPKLQGSILPGVTRDSVLKLCEYFKIPAAEKQISVDDLHAAAKNGTLEEAFGSGTAAVIAPVGELNYKNETFIINNNQIGPVAQKLYDEITGIQFGTKPDPFNWIYEIE